MRAIIRGYQKLKQSGEIDRIARVNEALTETLLKIDCNRFSPTFMGSGVACGEVITRQYLLSRIGGINLNRALLLSLDRKNSRVIFPLPKIWREKINCNNFRVARFRSAFLWQLYVVLMWVYGVVGVFKIGLRAAICRGSANREPVDYIYFVGLGPKNMPSSGASNKSYDIISWYLQWNGRNEKNHEIRHCVSSATTRYVSNTTLVYQKDPFPVLGWQGNLKYFLWGFWAVLFSFIDMMRGRWWPALLLNEAAKAAYLRRLPCKLLAREYLFHNSGWIYRPLWTYDAESRGSQIIFYFYSTNCESFMMREGDSPISYGYKAMSWSRYLVWDEYQAEFVKRSVGADVNINVVGPIWFSGSSPMELPLVNNPCVAVFDVTPFRYSRFCVLGARDEYYSPFVVNLFLAHVSEALKESGMLMLWKQKRNIGKLAHPQYRYYSDMLMSMSHVRCIDPDISAVSIVESSVAVISLPFTSTAIIARNTGKPSVYYDPTGRLRRDDPASHGIEILSGIQDLSRWIATHTFCA